MSKLFQAVLSGIFFTFILDFFLFLGIKENYIDFYKINVYYNILFADHQNIFVFGLFSLLTGVLIIYINNTKLKLLVLGMLFVASLSTLMPSVGYKTGEIMLMKKNVKYKNKNHTFIGDAYYVGRNDITFHDNELKKTIILNKHTEIEF